MYPVWRESKKSKGFNFIWCFQENRKGHKLTTAIDSFQCWIKSVQFYMIRQIIRLFSWLNSTNCILNWTFLEIDEKVSLFQIKVKLFLKHIYIYRSKLWNYELIFLALFEMFCWCRAKVWGVVVTNNKLFARQVISAVNTMKRKTAPLSWANNCSAKSNKVDLKCVRFREQSAKKNVWKPKAVSLDREVFVLRT